jgi:hypothetical protein
MNESFLINLAESAKTIPFAGGEAALVYYPLGHCTGILYQDHEHNGAIMIAVADRVRNFPLVVAAVLADLARQHNFFKVHTNPLPCIISAVRIVEEVAA